MVAPFRTPTNLIYDLRFSNQTDLTIQYQEAMRLGIKAALLLLGGGSTVLRSSNTVTADGNDNWNTNADIVSSGTPGNGSWIAFQLGNGALYGGSNLYCLLSCNDSASPPQSYEIRFSGSAYTGGTTTTLPTTAGSETTTLTGGNGDIIQWGSVTSGAIHYSTTAEGDFWLGVKEVGATGWRHLCALHAFSDDANGGGGQGDTRFAFYSDSQAANALTMTLLENVPNWRTLQHGGNAVVANQVSARSALSAVALGWANGQAYDGSTVPDSINVYDANSTSGRWLGLMVDWYASPDNLGWGQFIDNESGQTYRRVNFGPSAGGGVMLYMRTSDLGPEGAGSIP